MATKRKKIPTIMTAEELLDKAFARAVKISKEGDNRMEGKKRTAVARMTASGDIISTSLQKYVKAFPSMELREDFSNELIDLLVGMDQLKKSLGAMSWCSKRVSEIRKEYIRRAKNAPNADALERTRKEYYGRVSSMVNQIDKDLRFVSAARDEFRKVPLIETDLPTLVIAGFPNVGKSQLVERISTARPRIAPYPFTTKGIAIGHFNSGYRKFQVVDTPGLLDRDLEERNDIERQAIIALKYLADVIVFVLDPSETSGYGMDMQMKLLNSVKITFPGIPVLEVENKADIQTSGSDRLKISALVGEGVEELMAQVLVHLLASKKASVAPQHFTTSSS